MVKYPDLEELPLDGGWMCLDFVNTINNRKVERSFDYISTYDRFLNWIRRTESLQEEGIDVLQKLAKMNYLVAEEAHRDVLTARSTVYELFYAIANGKKPDSADIRRFNIFLSRSLAALKLNALDNYETKWKWEPDESLELPLHIVIKSAYDLLTSGLLIRVKECPSCGWLFLDKSKNISRKWCSMRTCGSSVKARRYYQKKKTSGK